ncbi:hypothetical protein FOCC_FOCC015215 [Frankliniella occidentalis]|nr:hypothetical protein FOCC_FOCC015215 [Frankliniella occidentalis]
MFSQGRRLMKALNKAPQAPAPPPSALFRTLPIPVPPVSPPSREGPNGSVAINFSNSEQDILNEDYLETINKDQRKSEWHSDIFEQTLPGSQSSPQEELGNFSRSETQISELQLERVSVIRAPFHPNVQYTDITPEDESFITHPSHDSVRKNLFPDDTDEYPPILTPFEPVPLDDLSAANQTLASSQYQNLHQMDAHTVTPPETFAQLDVQPIQFPDNGDILTLVEEVVDTSEVLPVSDATPPKKRQRNPSKSKAAIAKLANNSGEAHITLRGKEKKARALRNGCDDTCRKKCQENISEPDRQKLFKIYYGSKSKDAQWRMISKLAHKVPVARRTVIANSPYRKNSYKYYLTDHNGKAVPVCQTMFLDTFDISMSVVYSTFKKNSPDKRGKHGTRKRTSPIVIQSVKDHIKSFPLIESHYCREGTRKRYLQQNLSIAKMHRMYVMKVGEGENTATIRIYRDIFNCSFNLGFHKPKKDQCSLCHRWNYLSLEKQMENEALKKEYTEHQQAKTLVRSIRKEVKEFSRSEANSNNKVKVICFDLQKVFFCPKSEVGGFFYKRKLSCYNFTVYDCTKKTAKCYVWDMSIGGRGAVEISSCVYDFIKEEVKNGVTEFFIFSDSCWAQNKNQILFTMYSVVSQQFNIKITHRYLQKGHTQMECDSVHARIERKTRNTDIYTPMQWYGHILSAKVKKPSYIVIQVKQEQLVSFKELALQNFKWGKVPISKLHEVILDCAAPGKVYYKRKLDDPQTCFEVLLKKPGRRYNWLTFKPPQAYDGLLPLKPNLTMI